MIKLTWRFAHLSLSIVTCLFLFVASFTGVVLAIHAANERAVAYDDSLTVAETTTTGSVRKKTANLAEYIAHIRTLHPGLSSLSVTKYGQVTIETTDEDFNQQHYRIHPDDGSILGAVRVDSPFVQWNLSLHRSLFLHETGRFIVGIVSFLFIIIIISGVLLILKRQKKLHRFFKKPKGGSRTAKWHIRLGQLFFVPLLITSLTGTYLFMKRFQLLPERPAETTIYTSNNSLDKQLYISEFPAFQAIEAKEVRRIEFPFFDDPGEYYTLQLSDRELKIHPYSGLVVEETRYPFHVLVQQVSSELHTGSGSILWAIVLAVSALSITGFIVTGFAITYIRKFRRKKKKK